MTIITRKIQDIVAEADAVIKMLGLAVDSHFDTASKISIYVFVLLCRLLGHSDTYVKQCWSEIQGVGSHQQTGSGASRSCLAILFLLRRVLPVHAAEFGMQDFLSPADGGKLHKLVGQLEALTSYKTSVIDPDCLAEKTCLNESLLHEEKLSEHLRSLTTAIQQAELEKQAESTVADSLRSRIAESESQLATLAVEKQRVSDDLKRIAEEEESHVGKANAAQLSMNQERELKQSLSSLEAFKSLQTRISNEVSVLTTRLEAVQKSIADVGSFEASISTSKEAIMEISKSIHDLELAEQTLSNCMAVESRMMESLKAIESQGTEVEGHITQTHQALEAEARKLDKFEADYRSIANAAAQSKSKQKSLDLQLVALEKEGYVNAQTRKMELENLTHRAESVHGKLVSLTEQRDHFMSEAGRFANFVTYETRAKLDEIVARASLFVSGPGDVQELASQEDIVMAA